MGLGFLAEEGFTAADVLRGEGFLGPRLFSRGRSNAEVVVVMLETRFMGLGFLAEEGRGGVEVKLRIARFNGASAF